MDPALSNLAIDGKLRGRDVVKVKVWDVCSARQAKERASITQGKTRPPGRFVITVRQGRPGPAVPSDRKRFDAVP